jgi:hypothetical protein
MDQTEPTIDRGYGEICELLKHHVVDAAQEDHRTQRDRESLVASVPLGARFAIAKVPN